MVYLSKVCEFDPKKGNLRQFLWGNLDKTLLRESTSQLNFARSLDDNSDFSVAILQQREKKVAEEPTDPLEQFPEVLEDEILRSCLEFADSISGKSIHEVATMFRCQTRNAYQILKRECRTATAARLNLKKDL